MDFLQTAYGYEERRLIEGSATPVGKLVHEFEPYKNEPMAIYTDTSRYNFDLVGDSTDMTLSQLLKFAIGKPVAAKTYGAFPAPTGFIAGEIGFLEMQLATQTTQNGIANHILVYSAQVRDLRQGDGFYWRANKLLEAYAKTANIDSIVRCDVGSKKARKLLYLDGYIPDLDPEGNMTKQIKERS